MKQAHLFLYLESFIPQNISEDALENLLLLADKKPKNKIYLPTDYCDKNDFLCSLAQYQTPISNTDLGDIDILALTAMLIYGDEYEDYEQFKSHFENDNYGLIGLEYSEKPKMQYVCDEESWHELHCAYLIAHNEHINWNTHDYFPNLAYSNKIFKNLNLSNADKKAYAEQQGNEIARRNFYKKSDVLSKCETTSNKLRTIFYIKKEEKYQFLSIDFESGRAFEVCDDDGTHLGEYLFDGKFNKKASETDHSLSKECIKAFKNDMKNKRL